MDSPRTGHPSGYVLAATADANPSSLRAASSRGADVWPAVYAEAFPFVWRSARRLGVADGALDDVVQDVLLVVHRKMDEFEGRSSFKTWLFGIVLRVVRDHRRTLRRKSPHAEARADGGDPDALPGRAEDGPLEAVARSEAVRLLHELLETLDDAKREVFVLAELEQLPIPDIAEATGVNVNTVYSRLRAARQEFEAALARHHARDRWRHR